MFRRSFSGPVPSARCLLPPPRWWTNREALKRSASPEPDLYQEVAGALSKDKQPEAALAVLDQGLKTLGNLPSLFQCALEIELSLKRFDAALARVETMRLAAPRPEPWMARRAEILQTAARITEARDAWQALLTRIATLPPRERGSNAMCRFSEAAHKALQGLQGLATLETPQTPPQLSKPSQSPLSSHK